MKKVFLNKKLSGKASHVLINGKKVAAYEWQWVQKHACGCKTNQKTLGGQKPTKEYARLSLLDCPKCKLAKLLFERESKEIIPSWSISFS